MKKLLVIFALIVAMIGCGEDEQEIEEGVIFYRWSVSDPKLSSFNPGENPGRDVLILRGAKKASDKFEATEIKEIDEDILEMSRYILVDFEQEQLENRSVGFAQRGVLTDGIVAVVIQKGVGEKWASFLVRGFRELVGECTNPGEAIKPPEETIPSPLPPKKADTDEEEADAGPTEDGEEPPVEEFEVPITKDGLLNYPVFFAWQPGCTLEQILTYHPYVVEGLDRLILNSLTGLGIAGEYLFKMNINEPNELDYMISTSFSPESMKDGKVLFMVRTIELKKDGTLLKKEVSQEYRRKGRKVKNKEDKSSTYVFSEDWQPFYERSFCAILKKAKVMKNCSVR